MNKTRLVKRLAVPAVLLAAAGCTPAQKPCGSQPYDLCYPDGGYWCPEGCSAIRQSDGGPELDDGGMPHCLC